jgi:hypothetical protein
MTTSAPCRVYNFFGDTYEILLMNNVTLPENGQVPLLDSHDRYSVERVLGSCREIKADVKGGRLLGKVFFSATPEGDKAFIKVREGHLTDFSVGYMVGTYQEIELDQTAIIEGEEFTGPCVVVTEWTLKELSICPIGADPAAKARGEIKEEPQMSKSKAIKAKKGQGSEDTSAKIRAEDDKKEDEEVDEPEDGEDEEKDEEGDEPADEDKGKKGKKDKSSSKSSKDDELKRILTIQNLCRSFQIKAEDQDRFILNKYSEDSVRKEILTIMERQLKDGPGFGRVDVTKDERDKFRAQVIDGLLLRGGKTVEKPADGSNLIRGFSLKELARECLFQSGQSRDKNLDVNNIIHRALSTSDLPILLEETSRRFLLDGFEQANETWSLWTSEGTTTDFKTSKFVNFGVDNVLLEVPPDDEFTNTKAAEESESYNIVTYGRIFYITRQAIINDDLGALTGIPRAIGEGANRAIGDAVYKVLIENPAMGDNKALFSTDHKNLLTGGGVPDVPKLGAAETAMGRQKDITGRSLNIRPEYFIAPLSLRVGAETFFNSQLIGTAATPNVHNIYAGKFSRIYEPRLDDANPTTWFLAGPKNHSVCVFFLNGVKEPFMQPEIGYKIDGLSYKVRIDFGVKAVSWRALLKSAA